MPETATRQKCTECGKDADKLHWFPFATYACDECADKIRRLIEHQRRIGDVCTLCGSARRVCTC